jgi:hypothetical protein
VIISFATTTELHQCVTELDNLSRRRAGDAFLPRMIQQLQILQGTLAAGDAREIVFVSSEQLSSLRRSSEAFERIGSLELLERVIKVVMTVEREAYRSISMMQPEHANYGKMIRG